MARERTIVLTGVKGGLARSIYEPPALSYTAVDRQTFQSALDLDVYNDRDTIRPIFPALVDMPLPANDAGATAVQVFNAFLASNGAWYFQGIETVSGTGNNTLWSTSLSATPTWNRNYTNNGNSGRYPLEEYRDGLFFTDKHSLHRWGNLSGSPSDSTIGNLAGTTERYGHLLNHKGLAKIFFTHGVPNSYNKIGWYDNANFTEGVLNFGAGYTIVSIDAAGQYVCIGLKALNDGQRSLYLLWDGAAIVPEDTQDIGDTGLVGLRVINGTINIVTYNSDTTAAKSKLRIMTCTPGTSPVVQWQKEGASHFNYGDTVFSVYANTLFFGDDATMNINAYGTRFPEIPKYVTNHRSLNGAPASGSILFVKNFGQILMVGWIDTTSGTVYKLSTTGISTAQLNPATGVYTSNMIFVDDNLEFKGSIKKIKIYHKTLPANCGYTVWVKQYGRYIDGTTIPSADTFTKVGTVTATNSEYDIIADDGVNFDLCDSFQLQIKLDTVPNNSTNAPEIVFPVLIRVSISDATN